MAGIIINIVAKKNYTVTEIITQKRIKFFTTKNKTPVEFDSLINAILNSLNGTATILNINIQSSYLKKIKKITKSTNPFSLSPIEKELFEKLNEVKNKKTIEFSTLSKYELSVLNNKIKEFISQEEEKLKKKKEKELLEQKKSTSKKETPEETDPEINIVIESEIESEGENSEFLEDVNSELIGFDENFDDFNPDSMIVGFEAETEVVNIDNL